MTCSLANLLYSWVGAAALGGYIGKNLKAFVPPVISGASRTYVLTLMEDTNVVMALVIQPGQNVVISGDRSLPQPPTWGSGSFTVRESASLSLNNLHVDTVVQIDEGAAQLRLDNCVLMFNEALVLQDGLKLTMDITVLTSTDTTLLRDGMQATFIGMDTEFGGSPAWVITASSASPSSELQRRPQRVHRRSLHQRRLRRRRDLREPARDLHV